jgi:hypothetical protein
MRYTNQLPPQVEALIVTSKKDYPEPAAKTELSPKCRRIYGPVTRQCFLKFYDEVFFHEICRVHASVLVRLPSIITCIRQ